MNKIVKQLYQYLDRGYSIVIWSNKIKLLDKRNRQILLMTAVSDTAFNVKAGRFNGICKFDELIFTKNSIQVSWEVLYV